jgi:hypothetical protein
MKPQDGSPYAPDVEEAVAKATAGLRKNRDELLTERKRDQEKLRVAEEKLKTYDGFDIEAARLSQEKLALYDGIPDPEAARELLQAQVDYARKEADLTTAHTAERVARDTRIENLEGRLKETLVKSELSLAIAAKHGSPKVLLPFVQPLVRATENKETGEWGLAFLDEKGQERENYSMDKFVDQLMIQHPHAFLGTGSSGGGARRSANTGSGGSSKRTIASGDGRALVANLDAVIRGEVEVV